MHAGGDARGVRVRTSYFRVLAADEAELPALPVLDELVSDDPELDVVLAVELDVVLAVDEPSPFLFEPPE